MWIILSNRKKYILHLSQYIVDNIEGCKNYYNKNSDNDKIINNYLEENSYVNRLINKFK